MSSRSVCHAAFVVIFVLVATSAVHADIYRWDDGEVILATEDIDPGPGVDLSGMDLAWAKLGGWRLGEAFDLREADFEGSNLTNADLTQSTLTNANFSGATLNSAILSGANLTDADLTGANLTNAQLEGATLVNTNLVGAVVAGAKLSGATWYGFTKEQLYATLSYQQKNLRGIELGLDQLDGWDFSNQDLTNATFRFMSKSSNLGGANLSGAILTGVSGSGGFGMAGTNLSGAVITWSRVDFYDLTEEQLYSTASYKAKSLQGINISLTSWTNGLSGWDFSGQDLSNAHLGSYFDETILTGANLKNAYLWGNLQSAEFDVETTYNQWTVFPDDFDPVQAGLTYFQSPAGDFDANGVLDANDIDWLSSASSHLSSTWWSLAPGWLPPEMFDVNSDGVIDFDDHHLWVKDLKHTWYGDANLDGKFNVADFVAVLTAGKYEKELSVNMYGHAKQYASWSEGDWNGDGVFDTGDLVKALGDGGYEMGPRELAVVPEPSGWLLLLIGMSILWMENRKQLQHIELCEGLR